MRKPTERAIGLKSQAIIFKSWDKDHGSQPFEEHFEWFNTSEALGHHFDDFTAWAEKDVVDNGDTFYLTVEVLNTATMQLGRRHIVPTKNEDLMAALKEAQANPASLLSAPLSNNPVTNDLVDFVGRLGGDEIELVDDRMINCLLGGYESYAYVKDGGSRIRGSAYLDSDVVESEADEWVVKQPPPESALLEKLHMGNGDIGLRMLFERSVADDGLDDDRLFEEVVAYAEAWRDRTNVKADSGSEFVLTGDPCDVEPANAWLLLGDETSYPDADELLRDAARGRAGIYEYLWTTSKRTDVGDLMLMYFIAPHKAAHFVARSACSAFFDSSAEVNAKKKVAKEQWWCFLTPPIEIEAIPFATFRQLAGGDFPLRGKAGVYLTPDLIASLPIRAKNASDEAALERVLRPLVGRADLPSAEKITAGIWPTIASGALPLESQVEQYLVEPLLRLTLDGWDGMSWTKRMKVATKVTDYVVTHDASPVCVIEVKVAVREAPNGVWTNSKDFQQARGYADALACRSALIDANRVYLIDKGADQPHRIFERRTCTAEDLRVIGAHLRGDAS